MNAALNSIEMSKEVFNDVYRDKDTDESQIEAVSYGKEDVFGSEEGHAVRDSHVLLSQVEFWKLILRRLNTKHYHGSSSPF